MFNIISLKKKGIPLNSKILYQIKQLVEELILDNCSLQFIRVIDIYTFISHTFLFCFYFFTLENNIIDPSLNYHIYKMELIIHHSSC